MTLNRNNKSYYQNYLVPLGHLPQRGFRASEHLLRKAFEWFDKRAADWLLKSPGNEGRRLAQFVEDMSDHLFFTVITVTDELNAYKVFETLNARGVRLSATDLLKNYLFSVLDRGLQNEHEVRNLEERWESIVGRQAELLHCPYFHVVFTLPEEIAAIAYQNKAVLYNLLFAATAETLLTIAADPKHLGAAIGFFAVLHTWGQNLTHHPHLHCVVPGGGLSADGQRWVGCRPGFFLPVRVLSRFFRRRFLDLLEQAFDRGQLEFFSALQPLRKREAFRRYLAPLRQREWVVYAKAPFAGPEQVLDYVGRYTHRVAISNNRLLDIEEGNVTIRWKDYRDDNARKTMTLKADEFIRRFLLHVLPPGLQRIRYYGFMGNRYRQEKLERCRALLQMGATLQEKTASAKTDGDRPADYPDRYGVSPRTLAKE